MLVMTSSSLAPRMRYSFSKEEKIGYKIVQDVLYKMITSNRVVLQLKSSGMALGS